MKYLILGFAVLLLSGCQSHDEHYYRSNPEALQSALKDCPQKEPSQVSCEQLKAMASELNTLAYDLQMNPQAFGSKIISLQTELAQQEALLIQNPNKAEITQALKTIKQQLTMRMAIVRWLESPES